MRLCKRLLLDLALLHNGTRQIDLIQSEFIKKLVIKLIAEYKCVQN